MPTERDPDGDRGSDLLAAALVLLAALAVNLAAKPPAGSLVMPVLSAMLLGLSAWALATVPALRMTRTRYPQVAGWAALAFAAAPAAWGIGLAWTGGRTWPLEVTLLACVRNSMLACLLLDAGHSERPRWLAAAAGATSCIFAVGLANTPTIVLVITILYLTVASILVAGRIWRLDGGGTATWQRLPWLPLTALLLLIGGAAWSLTPPTWTAAPPLAQWLASSGGNERFDPNSQGGVGAEGQDKVDATEDADSDGGQGNVFIESHLPTFYDVMNDQAGEPVTPPNRNKAVSPENAFLQKKTEHSRHHQDAQQFSLYRTVPKDRPLAENRDADALLYVRGSRPVYLPMEAFGVFDGAAWRVGGHIKTNTRLYKGWNGWIDRQHGGLDQEDFSLPLLGGPRRHEIKIGQYRDGRVPLAADATQFRFGLAREPHLFRVDLLSGLLAVAQNDGQVPPGETLEVVSRSLRPSLLRETTGLWEQRSASSELRALITASPTGGSEDAPQSAAEHASLTACVERVAAEWTAAAATPWQKVEAIVRRLRDGSYTHDTFARPGGEGSPIEAFLLGSKRGPDYLFAASAVLLIRAAGHPARLVSGYYVPGDRQDPLTGTTAVQPRDLHFWVEVLGPGDRWVTVEPTPGYALPAEVPTWPQALLAALGSAWGWLLGHWLVCLTGLALLAGAWMVRAHLADLVRTTLWRLAMLSGRPELQVRWTLWLLEGRGWWAGHPRPPGMPVRGWYAGCASAAAPEVRESLRVLLGESDRLLYGEGRVSPLVAPACRLLARRWYPPTPSATPC